MRRAERIAAIAYIALTLAALYVQELRINAMQHLVIAQGEAIQAMYNWLWGIE